MRSLVFNLIFMSCFCSPALASTEGRLFGDMLRDIVEDHTRHFEGTVEFELRDDLLATSKCLEIPSNSALEFFYKNVMHHDLEIMSAKQRAIASVYFDSSRSFIFCEKTEDRTHGEYIEYDSIINMEKRKHSFTIIRDFSEGLIIDL